MLSFRVAKSDGSQVFHIFVWQSSKPDILIGEQNMNKEKNIQPRGHIILFSQMGVKTSWKKRLSFKNFIARSFNGEKPKRTKLLRIKA